MSRLLRLGAVGAILLVAVPAAVSATGQPQLLPGPQEGFPNKTYVLTLPERQELQTSQVEVFENGEPVDSLSVTTPGSAVGSAVVLAIDSSNSMQGEPIAEAMRAARTFADRRSTNTPLGVVLFDGDVDVLLPPTTDQAAIDGALDGVPPLAEGTHIYDGLEAAREQLGTTQARSRSIVLLSDGTDVGSTISRDEAISRLQDDGYRVFSVGLRSSTYDAAALQEIAEETNGAYAEAATASQLSELFDALGVRLANEYIVTYRSLEGPRENVQVSVRVAGYPGITTDAYTTPALSTNDGQPIVETTYDRIIESNLLMIGIVLIVVALFLFVFGTILRMRRQAAFKRRMGEYVTLPAEAQARERRAEIATLLSDHAGKPLRRSRLLTGFTEDCELAEIRYTPMTLIFWGIAGGILLALVMALILGSTWALLFGFLGPIAVRMYVSNRVSRKRKAFAEQLPDNLDVLASALRAGHSLVGALAVVAEDAPEPSKTELRRVIADEQLGAPLEDAFEVCVRRMANRDLEQVAVVALLQREAGGNAAEVIEQVAANVRSRMDLRRLVKTLTAQGRMARWIVSLLPVVLFFLIFIINRDYLRPLWTETAGIVGLVLGGIMIIIGSLAIKKIVNIKI